MAAPPTSATQRGRAVMPAIRWSSFLLSSSRETRSTSGRSSGMENSWISASLCTGATTQSAGRPHRPLPPTQTLSLLWMSAASFELPSLTSNWSTLRLTFCGLADMPDDQSAHPDSARRADPGRTVRAALYRSDDRDEINCFHRRYAL